jgi:hypothetical protein
MKTECTAGQLEFHGLGRRALVGGFNGGKISSESGGLLLREVEQRTHILKRLAGCFVDYRNPDQIEHTVGTLIKQRVMGLALGYEDLNDHDALRQDPLLALLSEVADPTGQARRRDQDKGCALAGKSTLNRLELTPWLPMRRIATRRLWRSLRRWMSCWWIFLWRRMTGHLHRSF